MNFKKIGVLLAVLVGLIILVQIVDKSQKKKTKTEGQLMSLDAEKVVRIELSNSEGIFVFQKQNTTWHIESPVKTRADKEAIEDILDNFSTLHYEREVGAEASDLSTYGLDNPEIQLKLYEGQIKTPEFVIQLGIKNPLDSSSYTKLLSRKKIVLTAAYKRDHLEKKLFDFRHKRFMEFESTEVKSLEFEYQGIAIGFRKKNTDWFMENPLFSLAQDSQVEDIIHSTNHLEARSFLGLTGPEQLKKLGFNTPLLELRLELANSTEKIMVVRQNDQYFAYSPGFEEIFGIEKTYIEHFIKQLSEFREHKVARFYSFDVREVEYRDKALHFVIQKDTRGSWKWVKPVLTEAIDENAVNDLLSAIEDLEAESFVDKPSGQEKFFSFFKIKINSEKSADNIQTQKISFSKRGENSVFVRDADLPYLFLVSPDILDKLPKSIDRLFQEEKED